MDFKKVVLPDSEIPRQWYNILADLPTPLDPPLHPGTAEPVSAAASDTTEWLLLSANWYLITWLLPFLFIRWKPFQPV